MTKVVQIQYSIKSAGSSAIRLQNAFAEEDIESNIISLYDDDISSKERITYLGRIPKTRAMIDTKIQTFLFLNNVKKFGLFSYPILGTNVARMEKVQNADIIYIHWALGGFLTLKCIEQLAKLNKPIILVLHDMWNITGGCHYSFNCKKYETICTECQLFSTTKKNDLSVREFKKKEKLYTRYNNLYFVSPSIWLFDCAKNSTLIKNKPIFYIPNIIDNKHFKPFDKNSAKYILNIDINEKVIAFGAVSVDSPYKGWSYLQKALEMLNKDYNYKNISILIFSSGYNKAIADKIPFKTHFMGRISDEYSINLVYNAADVFVVPSLADNLPTTVMESLCCGTPVVGFDVGGIPDMICHKENGYLAKYRDSEDLANGIKFCIENRIIGKILPTFEKEKVIKSHIDLINTLINKK